MKSTNAYLLRRPTEQEIDQVAKMTQDAVAGHRAQVRARWPNGKTLKGHDEKAMPPWDQATEEQREFARQAVRDLIEDAGGMWVRAFIPVAHITCGCTPIAMITMRVALVELGILPIKLPDQPTGYPLRQQIH